MGERTVAKHRRTIANVRRLQAIVLGQISAIAPPRLRRVQVSCPSRSSGPSSSLSLSVSLLAAPSDMSRATSSQQLPQPAQRANGVKADNVARTKVLLLGMRRSGKTSIQQVLFNNLAPKETLYLETTTQVTKHHFECVCASASPPHSP